MNDDYSEAFGEKLDPEWFKWVIHKQGWSIRRLGADEDIGRTDKTIRRAIKAKCIRSELLNKIAKKLDVYPEYLAGRYAWTLKLSIMDEEGVRDYWRDTYLDPKHFPYRLAERFRLGTYKHLMDTLLIHGISESEYRELDWDQRHELEQDLDRYTTRILQRWFPKQARPIEDLDYFQAMEWQDERDVIETMLEYLEERGFVQVYTPDPDDEYESYFANKYGIEN